jgi:hypothetical protein
MYRLAIENRHHQQDDVDQRDKHYTGPHDRGDSLEWSKDTDIEEKIG